MRISKYYIEKVKQLREPFVWMESVNYVKQSPSRLNNSYNSFASRNINPGYDYKEDYETEDEILKSNALLKATTRVRDKEITWARLFESMSDNLSKNLGFTSTPWYKAMQVIKVIYLALTMLN